LSIGGSLGPWEATLGSLNITHPGMSCKAECETQPQQGPGPTESASTRPASMQTQSQSLTSGHLPPSRRTLKVLPRTSSRYIPSGGDCSAESILRLVETAFADLPGLSFVTSATVHLHSIASPSPRSTPGNTSVLSDPLFILC
jgi:hypothetical protein